MDYRNNAVEVAQPSTPWGQLGNSLDHLIGVERRVTQLHERLLGNRPQEAARDRPAPPRAVPNGAFEHLEEAARDMKDICDRMHGLLGDIEGKLP